MLLPGKNKVPGGIKQGGGPSSAHGVCVCHLWRRMIFCTVQLQKPDVAINVAPWL